MRIFNSIQMMRGIAALSVVCGHALSLTPETGIDRELGVNALEILQSGVDVFFVISGFIIAYSATEISKAQGRLGGLTFAARRAERIYPLYWIVLLVAIVASLPLPIPGLTYKGLHVGPDEFSSAITPSLIFLMTPSNHYLPVAWTLCFEVSFYAAVALIILVAPKYVMEAIIFALVGLVFIGFSSLQIPGVFGSSLIFEFGFGVVVAYITQRGSFGWWFLSLVAAIACFIAGAFEQIWLQPVSVLTRTATFGAGSAFLIYAVVAAEQRGARFPAVLRYVGDISYSLYIWHHLLLIALATFMIKRLHGVVPGPILITIWIAIILVVAAASHRFIERGLSKWPRRLVASLVDARGQRQTSRSERSMSAHSSTADT